TQLQEALDLAELPVDLLQLRRLLVEDIEAVVVAGGHLIGNPAEVPLQLRGLLGELLALLEQLGPGRRGTDWGRSGGGGRRRGGGAGAGRRPFPLGPTPLGPAIARGGRTGPRMVSRKPGRLPGGFAGCLFCSATLSTRCRSRRCRPRPVRSDRASRASPGSP